MSPREPVGPNLRGPCPSCAAPVATDQRYCVDCGERLGSPLSLPHGIVPSGVGAARLGLPMPARLVATLALTLLGFGFAVGTAMSAALSEPVQPSAPLVAQAPSPAPPPRAAQETGPAPVPAAPPAPPAPPATSLASPYAPGITPSATTGKKVKPKPQVISGTVVHLNPVAGTYAVANGGPVIAIHAKKLPQPGSKVRTPVRELVNGTYTEDGKRKTKGRSGGATFSGTVTFRNDEPGKDFYAVSNTGSSVLVRVLPDANGVATPPPFGASVTVGVRLGPFTPDSAGEAGMTTTTPAPQPAANACDADGEAIPTTPPIQPGVTLSQTEVTVDQQSVTGADLEGIVQAVCPSTRQLVLSADDTRESRQDAVLQVGEGIDLAKVRVGKAIVGSVELRPPGLVSLGSLASDQGIKGADSQKQVQGSFQPG